MSKPTAVQWLWNNLTDDVIGDLSPKQIGSIRKLINQAKQIEKEQIESAWLNGITGEWKMIASLSIDDYKSDAEEYYNETFQASENG